MADIEVGFVNVCEKFGIRALNGYQREAITQFINNKTDVFINLPTGYGKSLVYQALPLIFDTVHGTVGHIVVVVSPLVSLMRDQVDKLRKLGISAVSLSDVKDEEIKEVEEGGFSLVYGSPEAWLKNERWRKMLSSDVYSAKLCAIAIDEAHVIVQWGTSNNSNMSAFRETYSELHELRSLAFSVRMLALTATATSSTKETIINTLLMVNPHIIYECPSKENIAYAVHYLEKNRSPEECFGWLIKELEESKNETIRTIIYCQTIKQCGLIYSAFKAVLGNKMYLSDQRDPEKVLVEMLHSCTPENNKKAILKAFQDETSPLRVLVATIAFGMGVDCKGVNRTVHFGPSKSIEAYIQESGRAGRDGEQSVAFIMYQGLLLNHVDKDMKHYVKTKDCRRKTLLHYFDRTSDFSYPHPKHLCCDNCAVECNCAAMDCGLLTTFPCIERETKSIGPVITRQGTTEQAETVCKYLNTYYKSLALELCNTSTGAEPIKTIINPQFLLGFSEHQISQVIDNLDKIFSFDDVLAYVEIWDKKHAFKILEIVSQVYGDVHDVHLDQYLCKQDSSQHMSDSYDLDIGLWDDLIEDDSLFELALDNLSLSQLDVTTQMTRDESHNAVVPGAALDALEQLLLPPDSSKV